MQTLVETKSNHKKSLIPKSFLQSGKDLPISESIKFKHPIIQEILDLDEEHLGLYSENIYYSMVNVFLTDPYDYMVFLDDKKIDYEEVNAFQVFCLLFEEHVKKIYALLDDYGEDNVLLFLQDNIYFKAFKFFFGIDSFFVTKDENGDYAIGYDKDKYLIGADEYEFIHEFVMKVNGIPETDKIYPEDNWAKQILIEDERERLKKQEKKRKKDDDEDKNKDRLGNLMSSITWSCNGGITPFNRKQLHMYDLIDGIERNDKLLKYKNTMTGYFSGCIEKKNIDFKEIHWST